MSDLCLLELLSVADIGCPSSHSADSSKKLYQTNDSDVEQDSGIRKDTSTKPSSSGGNSVLNSSLGPGTAAQVPVTVNNEYDVVGEVSVVNTDKHIVSHGSDPIQQIQNLSSSSILQQSFNKDRAINVKVPSKQLREISSHDYDSHSDLFACKTSKPSETSLVYVERHTPSKGKQPNPVINRRVSSETSHSVNSQKGPRFSSSPVNENRTHAIIQNIAGDTRDGSGCSSDSDIITVHEQIVTVNAKSPSSDTSSVLGAGSGACINGYADAHVRDQQLTRPTILTKTNFRRLRQGLPIENASSMHTQSSDDVSVTQFALSDKQKLLKENFKKRLDQPGAVKRFVQPKMIGHACQPFVSEQLERSPQSETVSQNTQAITAAVAASAAVAVTQPFLKAQQDMEHQMTKLLEQMKMLQHEPAPTYPPTVVDRSTMHGAVMLMNTEADMNNHSDNQLRNKLDQIVEKRIEHLEKVQQQQMDMQTKLLEAQQRNPVLATRVHHQSAASDRPAKAAFTKSKLESPKSRMKTSDHLSKDHMMELEEMRSSPLDTPAPRARPPRPTVFSEKSDEKTGGYLLKEILASQQTPERDMNETMKSNFSSGTYIPQNNSVPISCSVTERVANSTVEKSSQLVNDLSGLKQRMSNLLSDTDQWRTDVQKMAEVTAYHQRPSPLDPYLAPPMKAIDDEDTLVSKPAPEPLLGNAPVADGLTDIKDSLEQIRARKLCLDSNLETVRHFKQDSQLYSLVESLYQDSGGFEKRRIQTLVDKKIAAIDQELKRELADYIPEKEYSLIAAPVITGRSKPSVYGSNRTIATTARSDTRQTASRMSQARIAGASKKQLSAKQKEDTAIAQRGQPARTKPKVSRETSDEALARLYGKKRSQNVNEGARTSQIYSNLGRVGTHVQQTHTETARSKHSNPSGAKGTLGQGPGQFYFAPRTVGSQPAKHAVGIAPVDGSLIPMAIPLRQPRMHSGVTMPVTITTSAAMTTSPKAQPHVTPASNIAVVDLSTHENRTVKKPPALIKQILPQVNVESDDSDVRLATSKGPRERSRSPSVAVVLVEHTSEHDIEQDVSNLPDDPVPDLAEDESSFTIGTGISLPGYHPPTPGPQLGPVFPPRSMSDQPEQAQQINTRPSQGAPSWAINSDVIAADMRRRDLLENRATDWVEQEIMARMLTQMVGEQASTSAIDDNPFGRIFANGLPATNQVVDSSGREGLHLFIDAGQPLEPDLVNKLIEEVLSEKIRTMLGQAPDREDLNAAERVRSPGPLVNERAGALPQSTPEPLSRKSPPRARIHTPEVTPFPSPEPKDYSSEHSFPDYEPVDDESKTERQTPAVSPAPVLAQVMLPAAAATVVERRSFIHDVSQTEMEPESSVSVDIAELLQKIADARVFPEPSSKIIEISHMVSTPPASPTFDAEPVVPARVETPVTSEREEVKKPEVKSVDVQTSLELGQGADEMPVVETHPEPVIVSEKGVLRDEGVAMSREERPVRFTLPEPEFLPEPVKVKSPSAIHASMSRSDSQLDSDIESTSPITSMTETIGESLSVGQRLISRSEGQVPELPLDEVVAQSFLLRARIEDYSMASTLRDTDDLDFDMTVDHTASEGEILQHPYRLPASPDTNPMLARFSKVNKAPTFVQFDMPASHVTNVINVARQSTDEFSIGQTVINLPVPKGKSSVATMVAVKTSALIERESDKIVEEENEKAEEIYEPVSLPVKLEQTVSGLVANAGLSDLTGGQVVDQSTHPPSAVSRSLPTGQKRSSFPMVTVTAGGRTSPGGPRSVRPTSPEKVSRAQPISSMHLRRSDETLIDTMTSKNGSDYGMRSLTPDQMNIDAIIQSQEYMTQTLSQSEGGKSNTGPAVRGPTYTLNKSDDGLSWRASYEASQSEQLSQNINKSVDERRSMIQRQTTVESEVDESRSISESELRQLAEYGTGGMQPRRVSVKMPSFYGEGSESDGDDDSQTEDLSLAENF